MLWWLHEYHSATTDEQKTDDSANPILTARHTKADDVIAILKCGLHATPAHLSNNEQATCKCHKEYAYETERNNRFSLNR